MADTVRIQMMSSFMIYINEQQADQLVNRSRKGAALLQYLILNRGRPVQNNRLLDALWNDETSANPENALKTLVSRMRTLLNQLSPGLGQCIAADRGAYHFQLLPGMTVDLYEIEDILSRLLTAHDSSAETARLYDRLLSLYTGDLLQQNESGEWAMSQVSALHDQYMAAVYAYVDLLKDPALSAEDRAKYIETLDKKSQRLKRLIEDLFEVSKAATRNVAMHYAEVDLAALLKQVQYELADKTEASGIDFRWQLPEERMPLVLDGQKTCRIFENLVVNITKYGMPGTRAYITLMPQEHGAQVVFKNISATELDFSAEEITDRFVRGDRSRNTEGSGLGLAIAKSFAELQGGTFSITVDGDLFKATVTLPDTNQPEQPETLPLPAAPDADAQSAPQTGGALPAGI